MSALLHKLGMSLLLPPLNHDCDILQGQLFTNNLEQYTQQSDEDAGFIRHRSIYHQAKSYQKCI